MRSNQTLRVHHFEPHSRANGPGLRAVLWLQGCTFGCPGCFNPHTHAVDGGELAAVGDLFEQVQSIESKIEGLTVSGGEPLLQRPALANLLALVRGRTGLSVVVFTGFDWTEIQRMPGISSLLEGVDVLIAGRYRQDQRVAHSLTGSANKTFHFLTPRYSPVDFAEVPVAEVVLSPGGQIQLSGIDPLDWQGSC